MEEKGNMEIESPVESNKEIDMITMFDDCESGFLAKTLMWL